MTELATQNRFERAVEAVRRGSSPAAEAALLYAELTETERLGLLDGDESIWAGLGSIAKFGYNARPYVMGAVERLGIPGIRFVDGPRGCVAGHGTAFPVPMARGATWDVALEEQVGEVIGREIRAQEGNFFGGICINLPRHPAWGRIQESYGDEPYHLGEFGAALARGTQKYVMACVKHFALNSMENARFKVDVQINEADLHDMYLPHFKRVIDEGVAAVMSAYNSVNGEWAGQNTYLLTTVLRELWHWNGITISDFVFGIRDAAKSLMAGLDVEAPFIQQRGHHLPGQLAEGKASWDAVQRAGTRSIAVQLSSYAARDRNNFDESIMADESARALSRKVAARAMVLLKNEPVGDAPLLPLSQASISSIAVVGRLAIAPNMGDEGSSNVRAPSHVSPLEGIRAAFPNAKIEVVSDDDPQEAAKIAGAAQVAIIVAGYNQHDEGEFMGATDPALGVLFPPPPPGYDPSARREGAVKMATGGDRESLTLRPIDEEIIRAVAAANSRTIVAIVASGAVITEAWRHEVPALLLMWYAGMEGGHALADVLTGAHNPSGRLPFSIPSSAEHLPFFDREATQITYDRFHGQRLLDKLGVAAAFPHGFGLSYTRFSIAHAAIEEHNKNYATLRVCVENQGSYSGRHVVQAYGRCSSGPYAGQRMLLGFAVIEIVAHAIASTELFISFLPLANWDATSASRITPNSADIVLEISSFAGDPNSTILRLR
jgi:beta-glucosidase